jgi:carboxymethylenebutenolidase
MAACLAPLLPAVADSVDVTETDLDIPTPDGVADAYFARPSTGRYPGVLMWPDNRSLSPTFKLMGKRLAQSGYAVLIPNPYYRSRRAPVIPAGTSGGAAEAREVLVPLMKTLTADTGVVDAGAFLGFLQSQPSVDAQRKMATCGYSMIARQAVRTAASAPERIAAVALFHGDGLVTDQPDSPHLLLPKTKAGFFIAVTDAVDKRDPDATRTLRQLFIDAKLPADIEVFPGTSMGWCMQDSLYYNEVQARRAWNRMLVLFRSTLGASPHDSRAAA